MKTNVPPAANDKVNQPTKPDSVKKLKLVRAGQGIVESLSEGNMEKAFSRAIASGIKLADGGNPFMDPTMNPLVLAKALRGLGIEALAWTPESLFSAIDKKFNGWTDDKANLALEKFHQTGVIQTDVPLLVRQKLYAIRIIATSDTVHNQWHVFEKVGCAFNDRVAQFGIVERLSSGECARTIAIIEDIRPDEYAKEIEIYIAASCHEDGLLTLEPSRYLKMADQFLRQMNFESTGVYLSTDLKERILKRTAEMKLHPMGSVVENIETIQAMKLLAVDTMGDQVIA